MTHLSEFDGRGFRRFRRAYAVASVAALAYFVVASRGWFGVPALSRPRTSLLLMVYLAFTGLTWAAFPRSERWMKVFGSVSVIAFVLFVAATMAG